MYRNIDLPEQPPRETLLASIHELLTHIERKPGACFGKDSYTGLHCRGLQRGMLIDCFN